MNFIDKQSEPKTYSITGDEGYFIDPSGGLNVVFNDVILPDRWYSCEHDNNLSHTICKYTGSDSQGAPLTPKRMGMP